MVEITHEDLIEGKIQQDNENNKQVIEKETEVIGEARNEIMSELMTERDQEVAKVETEPTQITQGITQ